jgi:hypothetical protein
VGHQDNIGGVGGGAIRVRQSAAQPVMMSSPTVFGAWCGSHRGQPAGKGRTMRVIDGKNYSGKIYGEGIYEGIKESLILGKRKGVNA